MTVARPARHAEPPLPIPWAAPEPVAAAVPAGLRRRQHAARRLPPLPDGLRDPIAPPPPPQTVLQVQVGRRSCWYFGLDRRQATALFKRAGVTRFMEDTRGWCSSIEDAGEVLAVAQHGMGYRVAVEAADQ
jgi:hypothetical protein